MLNLQRCRSRGLNSSSENDAKSWRKTTWHINLDSSRSPKMKPGWATTPTGTYGKIQDSLTLTVQSCGNAEQANVHQFCLLLSFLVNITASRDRTPFIVRYKRLMATDIQSDHFLLLFIYCPSSSVALTCLRYVVVSFMQMDPSYVWEICNLGWVKRFRFCWCAQYRSTSNQQQQQKTVGLWSLVAKCRTADGCSPKHFIL